MIQNKLEDLLRQHDLTITELSKQINISRNSISNLINNNVDLQSYKTDTLNKICSFFQIGIEDFIYVTEEPISIYDNETPYINSDDFNNENFSISGTLLIRDRFEHIGQIGFGLNFDFSAKANLLIENKKTRLGFVKYSLNNELSYDDLGLQTASFTNKYYESITNNLDNVRKILEKSLDISLLEVKDELPFSNEPFSLITTGHSNNFEEKYKFTFFVDSSINKSKLLSFEVSEY
ncbi:helix-turn-helix transcriptional regulator [Enterococcus avium]|uniref:helix-turn-helix domain-containing protein n=1 Tax=Enterococcus avium TaxID=33945 RepID=UPI002892398C|nr:helix-turn-helix transcriptional regulator [Enterococcus avium]MDT2398710.1 helix-turn-helix transcriptional regulator [Enterococcus avium]